MIGPKHPENTLKNVNKRMILLHTVSSKIKGFQKRDFRDKTVDTKIGHSRFGQISSTIQIREFATTGWLCF